QERGAGQRRPGVAPVSGAHPGRAHRGAHCGSRRERMRVERSIVATTTPCWLVATWRKVTIPAPGLLADRRLPITVVSPYRVSPARTGAGNLVSPKPRLATIVPWVRWVTDWP